MTILALDLGTKTGWAMLHENDRSGGTWVLATPAEIKEQRERGRDRTGDVRFARLLAKLKGLPHPPDKVFFEDVQFSTTTMQTQLWATFRAAVWATFPGRCTGVPVGTLKLFATGQGNATKLMLGAYLVKKHPKLFKKREKSTATCNVLDISGRLVDDNETDAQHLLDFAICN